jgi:RimJ/RimL family protein N-acetyltransferase
MSIKLVDLYEAGLRREGLEFLYSLVRERAEEPEINISFTLPTFEEHRQFVTRRPYRFWYLIEVIEETRTTPGQVGPTSNEEGIRVTRVGYISATHNNEIGIVLRKAHRGRGYGQAAIKALIAKHKPNAAEPSIRSGNWLANIAPENVRSRRTFEKLGFRKIQETFALPNEETNGNRTEEGSTARST